jgi:flagellar FliL protein
MPEEAVEDLPPEKPKKASNPFIPIIAVLVLLPVLSFLMTDFVLIPRIKHAVAEETGAGVKLAKADSTEGKVSKDAQGSKKNSKGGHGKKGGDSAGPAIDPHSFEFSNIVANLAGSLKSRYLKISFTVEGDAPGFRETIEANEVKMIDATLGILTSLSLKDLESPAVKNELRSQLLAAFENALHEPIVSELYFSEFVVQ